MATDTNLAFTVLQSLEIAVLNRVGPGEYEIYGDCPEFYLQLFPSRRGGPSTSPWEYSPMLEYFVTDAEMFFSRGTPGSINSGVWQEDGICDGEQALYAQAMIVGEAMFIIIRLLKEGFSERVQVLRKAREQLLERRAMSADLENFKHKSRFDGLTKVLNKATFIERLEHEITHAVEDTTPLSIGIIDIDHFKLVNDTYGHLCGDAVLVSLGQILRRELRRDDLVARYGGEEFTIVTPNATLEQIYKVAEKLRRVIAEHDFSPVPQLTVSIGCTAYVPGEGWESFLQRADMALYEAKHSGRNAVRVR